MSTRMYIDGQELEILLSEPFWTLRCELGEKEIHYSDDECIPDYCTLTYKAKVKDISQAINKIINDNVDFYGGNEPTEKYYKDLLKYMNNMDGEEYLHYKAI